MRSFTEVGNSLVKGDGEREGSMPSPEPSRRGPAQPAWAARASAQSCPMPLWGIEMREVVGCVFKVPR